MISVVALVAALEPECQLVLVWSCGAPIAPRRGWVFLVVSLKGNPWKEAS